MALWLFRSQRRLRKAFAPSAAAQVIPSENENDIPKSLNAFQRNSSNETENSSLSILENNNENHRTKKRWAGEGLGARFIKIMAHKHNIFTRMKKYKEPRLSSSPPSQPHHGSVWGQTSDEVHIKDFNGESRPRRLLTQFPENSSQLPTDQGERKPENSPSVIISSSSSQKPSTVGAEVSPRTKGRESERWFSPASGAEPNPSTKEMAESANAQLVLEPIPSTSAECKGDASSTTLSIQMIQAESSSASPPETSTRSQTHSEKRESSEPLKNIIPMVIRKEGGSITRRGKLDTGSDFDIMSKEVLDALSMGMEDYQGDSIRGFGCKAPVVPLGKTKVEWHVYEKPKTYTTEFLVFSEEQTTDFDILLGWKTIEKGKFYLPNGTVMLTRSNLAKPGLAV